MAKRQRGGLPMRRVPTALSEQQRAAIIRRMNALRGRRHTFVAEIARQATQARGRIDDDVYGIVQATIEALAQNRGTPPPLVFAVSHYQTGKVEQVGFLPPGVRQFPSRGRFVTNDPRFTRDRLTGLDPNSLPAPPRQLEGPGRGDT